jgi:hypothetical protein
MKWPSGAKPQLNLFSAHATPAKGFMVPQAIFGGGPLSFISFWWNSLAATVFVTFAAGTWLYMHYFTSAGVTAVGKKDTDDDPVAKATALSTDDKDVLLSQVVMYSASMLIFLFGNFVKMQVIMACVPSLQACCSLEARAAGVTGMVLYRLMCSRGTVTISNCFTFGCLWLPASMRCC